MLRSLRSAFLLPALLAISACGGLSVAEAIDEKRIELYALEDAVRDLSPDLADVLLIALVTLESIADDLDAEDPSD